MRRTFEEVKRELKSKGLLFDARQYGEAYDIYGIASIKFESEPYHQIVVLRPETSEDDVDWQGRISFLIPQKSLKKEIYKKLLEREKGSTLPYQMFIVDELDKAEKAIRELLSDEPKVRKEDTPKASMTVADIEAVPENKWVDTHTYGGRCPYCGKELERKDWFGPDYYHPCSCEVGQAAHKHNERASEIERKRLDDRQKMFDAIRTVEDIKNFPKEIFIPMLNREDYTCPFCGKPLSYEIVGIGRDKCRQYHSCICELAQAAEEHNKHANPLA